MPLKFSSFISYPHGRGKIIKPFIERLRTELEDRIEPYIDLPPFHDEKRLSSGYFYNSALAHALCRSLTMVVVYMPLYESREYCLREFAAMEQLEQMRLKALAPHLDEPDIGMIFPLILRQTETSPPTWITNHRQCADFSRYQTGIGDIFELPEVIQHIEKIAQSISTLYDAIVKLGDDPCDGCDSFHIPPGNSVSVRQQNWNAQYPGRVVAP
jgi:hypothetical protein